MAGALKARVGGAWTYVKGIKGDTGPAGPPSVGLTTLTSDFDQTIRQTGPTGGPFTLLFRRNKEAYLNDRNDVDATGAADMGATITTYLNEYAAKNIRRAYIDDGSTYLVAASTITVPANTHLIGSERGYSGNVVIKPGADNIRMLTMGGDGAHVSGIKFDHTNRTGVVGIWWGANSLTVEWCHFYFISATGAGIKGGSRLYGYVRDSVFNAINGYGIDLRQSYDPGGYYGVNVASFERLFMYSNGGLGAASISGIWTMRDCDIEGFFTGPAVVSKADGANTYGKIVHTYFELTGGANQAASFGDGQAVFKDNNVYGASAATAGGYAVSVGNYVADVTGNELNHFETGIKFNGTSSFGQTQNWAGANRYNDVTTWVSGGNATRVNGVTASMIGGAVFNPRVGYFINGTAVVPTVVQLTSPTTDAAVNLGAGNLFHAAYTGATTMTATGKQYGMQFAIYFANANATLQTSAWNLLSGQDETPPAGTTKTFIVDYNQTIRETGPKAKAPVTKTATFTADTSADVYLCDATSGAITANLPTAATWTGGPLTVKKTDASANAVTVDPFSTQTVDGATTYALSAQYAAITVRPSGGNWVVTGKV